MLPLVGTLAVNTASNILSSLFSTLDPATSLFFIYNASTDIYTYSLLSGDQGASDDSGSNALTGSATPQLSGDILNTLMAMQQQSASGSAGAASGSSTSSDPVQQLFSAMDMDGNGSVSQSEMEAYVEKSGGTQADADALYNSISESSSTTSTASTATTAGISESQLSNAASQSQPAHHGHHHHHKAGSQPTDVASTLMQAVGASDDSSDDQDDSTIAATGATPSVASSRNCTLSVR